MARRVLDGNLYMTLATLDPGGAPRLSPVYFTPARFTDLYWVSSPDAHHSRNLLERPDVQIVIFDSSVAVGHAEAVYIAARAREVPAEELEAVVVEAFQERGGARRFAPEELRDEADLRLYVAHASSWEVLVRGGDPVHGSGIDRREPADPTA
jgi:nitroimidazol reductase NimA-like FMN-containing flavoprotein (pyridoxamine 5'-phosphate oxidase superfamily)